MRTKKFGDLTEDDLGEQVELTMDNGDTSNGRLQMFVFGKSPTVSIEVTQHSDIRLDQEIVFVEDPVTASFDTAGRAGDGRRFWKIEVAVWADEEQVSTLSEDIQKLLCPDPTHQPPCPMPWEVGYHEVEDSDPEVETLRTQVGFEYPQ